MKPHQYAKHPLDNALKERLHLRGDNPVSLKLIRSLMHLGDAVNRLISGHPFFALRQSEDLLRKLDGLKGHDLVRAVLAQKGGTRITPHGLDQIPRNGPVVIASTHPTGMFDFVAHAGALLEMRPDLKVVANRETEKLLGAEIIVPVEIDRHNRATSPGNTRHAMYRHLQQGGALLIFGSGRVPDRHGGRLVEPQWRRGATLVSKAGQAPIIPAALNARNSDAYYRTRAIARFVSGGNDNFGARIGSLRYSAELLDRLGGSYDVHYGAPLDPGTGAAVIKHIAESLVSGLYRGTGTDR